MGQNDDSSIANYQVRYAKEVPDVYDYSYHNDNSAENQQETAMIKIDVPIPLREEPKYPKEKWKAFFAFLILAVNFFLATISLALVHEKVPDRNVVKPLPDVFLDNIRSFDWALDVSEYLIMIGVNSCIILVVFHKHRFIVMRRIFLLMSLLYFMRAITMYVTVLPIASTTYYCSPKLNDTATAYVIVKRALILISGFGLSINGKHTYCGDYIYSGHTVMLVLAYLVISEYSPKKLYVMHWLAWINAFVGILMVLLAHGHYSIDIIIAYYVTTRLFWTFHTLTNNGVLLKQNGNNLLSREWWFRPFMYFERNTPHQPLPNLFEWPLPWPRRFLPKSPLRES